MSADATRRAVRETIAQGMSNEHSGERAIQLGQHLQAAVTEDTSDGAAPADVLEALREEAGTTGIYAALLELLLLASLDELTMLADIPSGDIAPVGNPRPAPPVRARPRRSR